MCKCSAMREEVNYFFAKVYQTVAVVLKSAVASKALNSLSYKVQIRQ